MIRNVMLLATAAAVTLACGDVEDAEVTSREAAETGTRPAGEISTQPAATLAVDTIAGDAVYLTDSSGRALYMLVDESEGETKCTGECLTEWPPFFASGDVRATTPLREELVGTRAFRSAQQVTYGGHPLYYYRDDTGPGQTKGQDVTDQWGEWYLVSPSGERVREHGDRSEGDRS